MRSLFFIIAIVICYQLKSTAQNTITVKVQVQHVLYGAQKKTRIIINNQLLSTNDSGIVKVTVPKTATWVKISLPQSNLQSNYLALYPPGGHLLLPRDIKETAVLIVGSAEDHHQLQYYLSVYRLKKLAPAEEKDRNNRLDSLRSVLLKLNVSEATIQRAEKAEDEKADYLSAVVADILDFRSSIADLRTSYKYNASDAFEKAVALDELIASVNRYNTCYGKFERQHASYELKDLEYWNNGEVIEELRAYSDFLINKVHAPCIYPMQEAVLQIRQYYSGKKKNKNLRKTIEMDTGMFISAIDKILPELDRETNRLIMHLVEN